MGASVTILFKRGNAHIEQIDIPFENENVPFEDMVQEAIDNLCDI